MKFDFWQVNGVLLSSLVKRAGGRLKYIVDYAIWGFQSDNIRKFDRITPLERPEIRRVLIRNHSFLEELMRNYSRNN